MIPIKNILVSVVLILGLIASLHVPVFAQENYSCGTYSASTYGNSDCGDQSSIAKLSETGKDVAPFVLIGLLLLAGGGTLFVLAQKKKK